jgi:rhomboid protease GluP
MTPAQAAACAHCGGQPRAAGAEAEQALHEERFARAFFARRAPLTYSILAFNVALHLLMAAASPDSQLMLVHGQDRTTLGNPLGSTLVAFGAKTDFHLWVLGQWFRLVTPIFLHIGLLHLVSNSYALTMVGPLAERLFGSARFALIYLLAGAGGVLSSFAADYVPVLLAGWGVRTDGPVGSLLRYFLQRGSLYTPGAGASGALFGLFGVLFVVGFKYRRELPPAFRRAFGSGVLPVIAINLFIGFTVPFIDNAAHLGGLVTGALLALVVPYQGPERRRGTPLDRVLFAACLLVVAWCFFRAYQVSLTLAPRPAAPRPAQVSSLTRPARRAPEANRQIIRSDYGDQESRRARRGPHGFGHRAGRGHERL